MEFDLTKCSNQQESNKISRSYYEGICIFTGLEPVASHIWKIGKSKNVGLRKHPIAAVPMNNYLHINEYEDIPEDFKIEWLIMNVISEYRGKLKTQLKLFIQLCDKKNIQVNNKDRKLVS